MGLSTPYLALPGGHRNESGGGKGPNFVYWAPPEGTECRIAGNQQPRRGNPWLDVSLLCPKLSRPDKLLPTHQSPVSV